MSAGTASGHFVHSFLQPLEHPLITDDSALDLRAIKIRLGPHAASRGSIHLPYELLCSVSNPNHAAIHCPTEDNSAPELWVSRPHTIDALGLFVQWLCTGKYTEVQFPVTLLDHYKDPLLEKVPNPEHVEAMDCAIQAAVMAWHLGEELHAPGFQNHAMKRLFAAFARPSDRPKLSVKTLQYITYHARDTKL